MKKLTKEEFIEHAKCVHGDAYDYSKVNYINSRTKVCIICKKHGEFWQEANGHLLGHGCPICYRNSKSLKINPHKTHRGCIKTTDRFIQKAIEVHGTKYDYSKTQYINSKTRVCIICPLHGEFWQIANNHLQGRDCNKCKYETQANNLRSSKEEFIKKANKIHNNFYDYLHVNYITNRIKVAITCPKHGDFWQEPHEHLTGYGCKKCLHKTQTKIFNELVLIVPDLLYEVSKSIVPWLLTLRLDMYSPKYNMAIECDGPLHFIPIDVFGGKLGYEKCKKNDALKNELCAMNKCQLFRIKVEYTEQELDNLKNQIKTFINL